MLGSVQRMLRFPDPGLGGGEAGVGCIELLLPLIHQFLRGPAVFQKRPGSFELLLGQRLKRLLLDEGCLGFIDGMLGLPRLRFGLRKRLLCLVSIRATTCPGSTMSPMSTRREATRPANFVLMSISSDSMRPLP